MGISLAPKETTWDPHTPNLPQVLLCCIECQPALVVPMETEPCDTLPNSRHKALARPFFFFFFSQPVCSNSRMGREDSGLELLPPWV